VQPLQVSRFTTTLPLGSRSEDHLPQRDARLPHLDRDLPYLEALRLHDERVATGGIEPSLRVPMGLVREAAWWPQIVCGYASRCPGGMASRSRHEAVEKTPCRGES
jgi:hypothetical protein